MKKIVFTFGRFQVPTKGHAELINFVVEKARQLGAEHRIYTSQSHDSTKNPLTYQQKIGFLRQLFPGVNIIHDPNAKSAFHICKELSDQGYDDVTFVVGGDRVAEFKRSIGKYVMPRTNPKFDKNKNYAFIKFNVIDSGARKEGVSGTQMRSFIKKGDFKSFMKVAPTKNTLLAKRIFKTAQAQLSEELSRKDFHNMLQNFVDFTVNKLEIKNPPKLTYKNNDDHGEQPSFGGYSPHSKEIVVMSKNRHPMDIFRTVAHELVHHKQNEDGRLGHNVAEEGATGSDIENEANAVAGKVMRWYGKAHPDAFTKSYVIENKAIILGGVPGSGKDRILRENILPYGFTEVNPDNFTKHLKEGIVVNGATNYNQIERIKSILESNGYETMLVFVNTSNEVSKQRNEARSAKGGRVINETVRFGKWQSAQEDIGKYVRLFETAYVTHNDEDANDASKENQLMLEWRKNNLDKAIHGFAISEADRKFEKMLNEVGGAGNWGTPQLTTRYQKDTPGQPTGFKPMKVLKLKKKMKTEQSYPALPLGADRIGQEAGSFGSATYGDNQTISVTGVSEPIARWIMKEETQKRFLAKYGDQAKQKLHETAMKLAKCESLEDGVYGGIGGVSDSTNKENNTPDTSAEYEKLSFHKYQKRRNSK